MSQKLPRVINREKTFFEKLWSQKQLLLMSLPITIYIIIFYYVPLWGWTMAFQNYKPAKPFGEQVWVGFKWFIYIFKDVQFLRSLKNTIGMSLINMTLGYFTAIFLALQLNEVRRLGFKKAVQTISYLPHFLSTVIVTALVSQMLAVEDGAVNNVLMALGLIERPITWLSEPKYFWGIIGATYVWKEVGWNTIIYLAAIVAIDPCLYEAAEIDGCGRFRKMWYVTLPGIKATVIIMLIMSIGHILDAGFELQYLLKNGLVQDVAETIDLYVLKFGIQMYNYSLATAAGIFKNIVNIMLLLFANAMAKRAGEERLI